MPPPTPQAAPARAGHATGERHIRQCGALARGQRGREGIVVAFDHLDVPRSYPHLRSVAASTAPATDVIHSPNSTLISSIIVIKTLRLAGPADRHVILPRQHPIRIVVAASRDDGLAAAWRPSSNLIVVGTR